MSASDDSPTIELRLESPSAWLEAVLVGFDVFLLDHAAAERKASAMALSLISHYPDRKALVESMMDVAREELEHFYQVYRRIEARGLCLGPDEKDPYVRALRDQIRKSTDAYFLDRLLVSGIVEARGSERFRMIGDALPDPELSKFYLAIAASEDRHRDGFVELARLYFPSEQVADRLDALLDAEAAILAGLEVRAALH